MVSKRLAIIGGLVVGFLTVRSPRKRPSTGDQESDVSAGSDEAAGMQDAAGTEDPAEVQEPADSEDIPAGETRAELAPAADHAAAAVDHARIAVTKALEERQERME